MRAELQQICAQLLAASAADGRISLDAIGDAIGARRGEIAEIEALIAALEDAGRHVVGPEGGGGEGRLGRVVNAARRLRVTGVTPTIAAIVAETGMSREEVQHALALARVMQR